MSDADISQFVALTGAGPEDARRFLEGADLQTAVSNYYAVAESGEEPSSSSAGPSTASASAPPPADSRKPTGYTLDGRPIYDEVSLPKEKSKTGRVGQWGGSSSAKDAAGGSGPRIATLGGMGGPSNDDDDDREDDEEERKKRELYAGGGRSGLAVEDPNADRSQGQDVIQEILRKAREGGAAGPSSSPATAGHARAQPPPSSAFTGGGMTLGSDETPSVAVPDPSARQSQPRAGAGQQPGLLASMLRQLGGAAPPEDMDEDDEEEGEDDDEEVAIRHLTFWRDGFSVEDGPLMRYDDPANRETLEAIKAGRAPLSMLNVRNGQAVELRVAQRQTEAYQPPPPRPMRAFEGSGNRLGSPVPEVATSGSTVMPGGLPQQAASAATAPEPSKSAFSVDDSKPTTSVQVRLADGTKLVARMNLSHTVGDIRGFISASQPGARPYVIMTTFPNKTLDDDSQTIEEAKLQNAVIVQRWS